MVLRIAPWGVLTTFEQIEIVGDDGWTVGVESLAVVAIRGGLVHGIELFATEQLDAALARFDELSEVFASAPTGRLENAATQIGNRRVALLLAGDVDGLDDLTAPGFVHDDRRTLMHTQVTATDLHPGTVSIFTEATSEIRADTLATRGERLALVRVRFEIDGFEVDFLAVEALDAQHRQVRTVLFDLAALGPAFDELNRQFIEGEGAPSVAFLSTWVTMTSALNNGDTEAFTAAVPDHIRISDHRPMGWPEMDRQQFIELMSAPDAMRLGDHRHPRDPSVQRIGHRRHRVHVRRERRCHRRAGVAVRHTCSRSTSTVPSSPSSSPSSTSARLLLGSTN